MKVNVRLSDVKKNFSPISFLVRYISNFLICTKHVLLVLRNSNTASKVCVRGEYAVLYYAWGAGHYGCCHVLHLSSFAWYWIIDMNDKFSGTVFDNWFARLKAAEGEKRAEKVNLNRKVEIRDSHNAS